MSKARLIKHPADRVWAGVCAGLAAWFGLDPVVLRLVWLVWAVQIDTSTAFLAYIALMIVMPEAPRDEREAAKAARRAGRLDPFATTVAAQSPAAPAAAAPPRSTVAVAVAPARTAAASPPHAPTADELGDVVLKLLDATATVAVSIGRAAVLAARAAVLAGRRAYHAPDSRRGAPRPARGPVADAPQSAHAPAGAPTPEVAPAVGAGPTAASTSGAPSAPATDDEPHLESDEERLHRELRARLDAQVGQARSSLSAVDARVATRERSGRRRRLRQLVGFGVLALGFWGLTTTLGVHPATLTGAALATLGGGGAVLAAALLALGTYLLWTAIRSR